MGEILLMLLTGGGSTAMGAMLKGGFGMLFESRRQKHELELAREAVQTKIFLSSKLNWLKEVIMSSGIFLVELLLLWALALCVCASCSAPFFHRQSSSPSPTRMAKAEQNGSSVLLVTQPAKTPSRYRVATSPIWVTPPLWESSDFILGHHPADDK